ncbi:hypothetical protein [Chryseobacterium vrystaatense]|uniref:Membrane fusion protein, Cu(I)/Ag(I) efflux system n=1 Tax=Chryseobacterium vrystaatense TaxID=307480 RepID=A0ABR4UL90_9FLAO|nr:hypothetical protein [Chryseobacterium vrystaatense]KFF25691.1 hypothetical protein IW16_12450 [Chryseobacterium vrystaatense]
MKINIFKTIILTSIVAIVSSCGTGDKKEKNSHTHTDGDGHHHTQAAENKKTTKKINQYENELGQALDKNGKFITGCPSHKEMIGSEGDTCPKCGYMTMLPITWSLEGIDTVRVTSLPDYNPPADKLKK